MTNNNNTASLSERLVQSAPRAPLFISWSDTLSASLLNRKNATDILIVLSVQLSDFLRPSQHLDLYADVSPTNQHLFAVSFRRHNFTCCFQSVARLSAPAILVRWDRQNLCVTRWRHWMMYSERSRSCLSNVARHRNCTVPSH